MNVMKDKGTDAMNDEDMLSHAFHMVQVIHRVRADLLRSLTPLKQATVRLEMNGIDKAEVENVAATLRDIAATFEQSAAGLQEVSNLDSERVNAQVD